jgi:hypothetical protein
VNRYPVGARIVVHYKYDEPTFAVLEPQEAAGTRAWAWMAAGVAAISAILLGVYVWMRTRAAPAAPAAPATAPRMA